MTPTHLSQKYRGGKDSRPVGDCYRTAWASLLGRSTPHAVPHFVQDAINLEHKTGIEFPGEHFRLLRTWLREAGPFDAMSCFLDVAHQTAIDNGCHTFPVVADVPSRRFPKIRHMIVWDAAKQSTICDPAAPTGREAYDEDEISSVEVLCLPYDITPDDQAAAWALGETTACVSWTPYLRPTSAWQHLRT